MKLLPNNQIIINIYYMWDITIPLQSHIRDILDIWEYHQPPEYFVRYQYTQNLKYLINLKIKEPKTQFPYPQDLRWFLKHEPKAPYFKLPYSEYTQLTNKGLFSRLTSLTNNGRYDLPTANDNIQDLRNLQLIDLDD